MKVTKSASLDLNSSETQYFTEQINNLLTTLEEKEEKLIESENELKLTKEELKQKKIEIEQYMNNELDLQQSDIKTHEDEMNRLLNIIEAKDVIIDNLEKKNKINIDKLND